MGSVKYQLNKTCFGQTLTANTRCVMKYTWLKTLDCDRSDVSRFDTLLRMQIVDIQCRPIIYSTCVRKIICAYLYTYIHYNTLSLSPPPLCHFDHNLMHPSYPSARDTVQSFPPFCRKSLKKTFLWRSFSSLRVHLSIMWRGWREVSYCERRGHESGCENPQGSRLEFFLDLKRKRNNVKDEVELGRKQHVNFLKAHTITLACGAH